jgi:putative transcriptional regulator
MKDSDFQLLVTSVRKAGEIRRGRMKPAAKIEVRPEDVKAIRSKLSKSQSEFALMIGVSVSTLQNWEQGRRQPEGPARALLKVASMNPSAVAAALDTVQRPKGTSATGDPRRR